jgi:2-iminobutanoate/2-iminopropanoate deaminase
MKKIVYSPKAPAPIGPYSQAVKVDNTLYLSGQIAINAANGSMVNDSIENETKQVMENIGHVLEAAGMDFTNLFKCSIFLKDMDNFSAVNEVYGSYFSSDFPARECVQVAKLPKNVNVEITALAADK